MMATSADVAQWMLSEIERDGVLYQDHAVSEIDKKFGSEFTGINDLGNLSISRDVLSAFRKLSAETIVWERGERLWRVRETHDEPGRLQQ